LKESGRKVGMGKKWEGLINLPFFSCNTYVLICNFPLKKALPYLITTKL